VDYEISQAGPKSELEEGKSKILEVLIAAIFEICLYQAAFCIIEENWEEAE